MSSKQTLKDANYRTIGYIETDSSGKQTLKDPNYRTLGYYEPKGDVTKDVNYRTVGRGNILTSLLR